MDVDDLDQDAKQILEEVADEAGFDVSELQIPKSGLEEMFEAFDEEQFREGLKKAFEQL